MSADSQAYGSCLVAPCLGSMRHIKAKQVRSELYRRTQQKMQHGESSLKSGSSSAPRPKPVSIPHTTSACKTELRLPLGPPESATILSVHSSRSSQVFPEPGADASVIPPASLPVCLCLPSSPMLCLCPAFARVVVDVDLTLAEGQQA